MDILVYLAVTKKKESTRFILSSLISYNSGSKKRLPMFSFTCKKYPRKVLSDPVWGRCQLLIQSLLAGMSREFNQVNTMVLLL